jgi:hypothetical protein
MTTTIEPALFTHETPLTQFDDDLRETIIGRLCDFELVHVDQEDSQVLSEIYKVWVPVVLEDLSEERALLVFQQFYNRNPKQEVDRQIQVILFLMLIMLSESGVLSLRPHHLFLEDMWQLIEYIRRNNIWL